MFTLSCPSIMDLGMFLLKKFSFRVDNASRIKTHGSRGRRKWKSEPLGRHLYSDNKRTILSGPEYTDCIYDTKQLDGEASVMPDLWETLSTPSSTSLLSPLWVGVVAPDRVLSLGQILLLNCVLMLNWIVWNRTVKEKSEKNEKNK